MYLLENLIDTSKTYSFDSDLKVFFKRKQTLTLLRKNVEKQETNGNEQNKRKGMREIFYSFIISRFLNRVVLYI